MASPAELSKILEDFALIDKYYGQAGRRQLAKPEPCINSNDAVAYYGAVIIPRSDSNPTGKAPPKRWGPPAPDSNPTSNVAHPARHQVRRSAWGGKPIREFTPEQSKSNTNDTVEELRGAKSEKSNVDLLAQDYIKRVKEAIRGH